MFKKTFDSGVIEEVWRKAKTVPGWDSTRTRKDNACGATIQRSQYGNRDSKYGWEVDHINPDGSDNISNLQPLQWENNVAKSDARNGKWVCAVSE